MSETPNPSPAPEAPLRRIPFTAAAEANLRALCGWMQVAAVFSILGAVAKVVSAFTPQRDFGKLIDAALTFLIGLWIYQAGTAFRKVATTDTADQRHLMEGFTLLRRVFLLQSILVIIVLTFLAVAVVLVTVLMATRR